MKFTEKEISTLVASVEKEFARELAKVEENLAKSESASAPLAKAEDAPPEKKEEKSEEKPAQSEKPEQKEEPKKEEGKEAAPAAPAAEEPKANAEQAPAAAQEAAPAKEGADNQEGHDYDEQDIAHMHDMYSSMSRGELKAHHDSVKRALDAQGAQQQAAPAAPAGELPMSKSEDTKTVEVKPEVIKVVNQETDLLKSELAASKAKSDELQKNLDAVAGILTKLVEKKGAPQAKAITSLDAITKSEGSVEEKPLSKSEIDSALNKAAMDTKLAKSDRDAINAYYLNGASFNTISHLVK